MNDMMYTERLPPELPHIVNSPDCNDCQHMSLKEADQTDNREPHMCTLYNKRCFHIANTRIHLPKIMPCAQCALDYYKNKKEIKEYDGN